METERERQMSHPLSLRYLLIPYTIYESLGWCAWCPVSRLQLRARVSTRIVIC